MKKNFMLVVVASFMLASCSKEDVNPTPSTGKTELGISAVIAGAVVNRGLTDNFATDSVIDVFIENEKTGETDYTPKIADFIDNAATWETPDSTKIYLTNEEADVYAFYPKGAVGDVDFGAKTLKVNVDSVQNFDATSQKDYMYGTAREGSDGSYTYPLATASNAIGSSNVDLFFHHVLSELSFIVNRGASYTGAGVLTSVKLTKSDGFLAGTNVGTVSLSDGAISGLNVATNIVFTGSTTINAAAGTTALVKGLVAPITATTGITLTLTIDGKDMVITLPSTNPANAWAQGKNYTYTINVQGTELSVVTVAITAWENVTGGTVVAS
ncbi:MAG: fimbrillin family protein [Bacteroidaceae bacterium]